MRTLERRLHFAKQFTVTRGSLHPGMGSLQVVDLNPANEFGTPSEPQLERRRRRELRLRPDVPLSQDEVRFVLNLAEENNHLDYLNQEVSFRLQSANLACFRQYAEIEQLRNREINGQKLRDLVTEEWATKHVINNKEVSGVYIHNEKKIKISSRPPTTKAVLGTLAEDGNLPWPLRVLKHEETHSIQENLSETNFPAELLEAQAYRTDPETFTQQPADRLINTVLSSEANSDLSPRKLTSAVWSVDRLNALGFSVEEVLGIISNAGEWDEAAGIWPNIDIKITEEMKRKHLDEEGLERVVMKYSLDKANSLFYARNIVQEVLYDAYRNVIDARRRSDVPTQPKTVFTPLKDVATK